MFVWEYVERWPLLGGARVAVVRTGVQRQCLVMVNRQRVEREVA